MERRAQRDELPYPDKPIALDYLPERLSADSGPRLLKSGRTIVSKKRCREYRSNGLAPALG